MDEFVAEIFTGSKVIIIITLLYFITFMSSYIMSTLFKFWKTSEQKANKNIFPKQRDVIDCGHREYENMRKWSEDHNEIAAECFLLNLKGYISYEEYLEVLKLYEKLKVNNDT